MKSEFSNAFSGSEENSELKRLTQYLIELKTQSKNIEATNELKRQIREEHKKIKELKGGFFSRFIKRY